MRTRIRKSAGLSEESADEASNLMRRPVQQGNRDATTSACVGWEYRQYRKSTEFPQDGVIASGYPITPLKTG